MFSTVILTLTLTFFNSIAFIKSTPSKAECIVLMEAIERAGGQYCL
jgi:hypothetical protein